PSAKSGDPVEPKDPGRERRADDHRDRRRRHEQRARARPLRLRKPVREEEDDAGEETGFGDAEQYARAHERPRVVREDRGHRDQSPGNHDASDPATRAHAFEDEIARDLEDAVAQKEQTGRKAVRGSAQVEIALQVVGHEPDVDAIEIGDDVANKRERDEAPADTREDAPLINSRAGGRGIQERQDSPASGWREPTWRPPAPSRPECQGFQSSVSRPPSGSRRAPARRSSPPSRRLPGAATRC